MVFDVILKEGVNAAGRPVYFIYRVHSSVLGAYVRNAQDNGKYIHSIIPLYPVRREYKNIEGENRVGGLMDIDNEVFNTRIGDIEHTEFDRKR